MRIFLVGVACVGKTTIGTILARSLEVPFFDLDAEIERHFATSIERLRVRFLTDYSYRKECAVVLKQVAATHLDCVIALPAWPSRRLPASGAEARRNHSRGRGRARELARITFYDIDSTPLDKRLTDEEKRL